MDKSRNTCTDAAKRDDGATRVNLYDKISISPLGRDVIIAVLSFALLGFIIYAVVTA